MKTVTLNYLITKVRQFQIPTGEWEDFFDALRKQDSKKTAKDWQLLGKHSLTEFLQTYASDEDVASDDDDIIVYDD